ncbi:MAG: fibrobacter succinogenes major paralogous domain-containing protein [Candidatus Moranbacteria bacterium]|jgi:uncharacterized protein (TIGR02145 family)|nr:fibrobacter succinogenes major paralogous domain-containing protein [Candidatus Moranbacteria bacterium]
MFGKGKNNRGSVLVFALLVLSIFLSVALSMTGIVILGKNSSRASEKSILAFQIADGAAENVLKRIYKDSDATLNDLAWNLYANVGGDQTLPTCVTGGVIHGQLPSASSGAYQVTFYDESNNPLSCSSPTWHDDVRRIVASGTFGEATRAIDVGIRPRPCNGLTSVNYSGYTYDTVEIGNQCWMQQNLRVGNTISIPQPALNNGGGNIEKYCYGNSGVNCSNNPNLNNPDGGLYAWDEAMQYSLIERAQGICPTNWHIPSNDEWYQLEQAVDATVLPNAADDAENGTDVGAKLRSNGLSGFEGNLAGGYSLWSGIYGFRYRTTNGFYWSSTVNGGSAWSHSLASAVDTVKRISVQRDLGNGTQSALSVRCLKD